MMIKLFDNSIEESNPGLPYDVYFSGRADIQAYELDGEWVDNPAFNLNALLDQKNEVIRGRRRVRYRNESDPLFFKVQRGEIDQQVWLDQIQAIQNELPYYTEETIQ